MRNYEKQNAYRAKIRADPIAHEAYKVSQKEYRENNKQRLKELGAAYQKKHAVRLRLKKKGLSADLVPVVESIYLCEICGNEPSGRWNTLHIDHCHKTGKYRGMLCDNCNVALGHFKDSPELLAKAIKYLQRNLEPKSN